MKLISFSVKPGIVSFSLGICRQNEMTPDNDCSSKCDLDHFAGCLLGGAIGDAFGSSIRYKTIAHTFEKIGIVEGWGSGLKRIIQMCRTYGVESPQFIEIGDMRPGFPFMKISEFFCKKTCADQFPY